MSSWFDPYARTATENLIGSFAAQARAGQIGVGPLDTWSAFGDPCWNVDFGPAATLDGNIAPDYVALRRAWFDRHQGFAGAGLSARPVKIFVMGGGRAARTPKDGC